MPKLPQVSGQRLVRLLRGLGYQEAGQRGSHKKMVKETAGGKHTLTIPMHQTIAKGTLHDILKEVSRRQELPVEQLLNDL